MKVLSARGSATINLSWGYAPRIDPFGCVSMGLSDVDRYARIAAERMRRGRVIPFLGAGVNLADRGPHDVWDPGTNLPSGAELAERLASKFDYPESGTSSDLMRVSQYIDASVGETAIYDEFRDIFCSNAAPSRMHRVLAEAPAILRQKGLVNPHLLIVTTNYDDAQERAFDDAGEDYDVVWYMARGDHRGQFVHEAPGSVPTRIDEPAKSTLSAADRNVILKIHGAAYRSDEDFDSFIVTEDHYIEYMYATDLVTAVPVKLMESMLGSHFLFLGYRLGDWNLRVFLHGLWARRDKTARNWAVDREHRPLDQVIWDQRSVEMIEVALADYADALRDALDGLEAA